MSPVRPKYKYDENCHSGSSSEKKSSDPKGLQSNQPKSPEDTSLDVTSEQLSPRRFQVQVQCIKNKCVFCMNMY